MAFFDTHNHLDYLQQDTQESFAQLVANAVATQVEKMLIVAVRQQDFARIESIAISHPQHLYYGLGLHPLYIQQHQEDDLQKLEKALTQRSPSCTAIAEIGLERAVQELNSADLWAKQCYFFEAQLYLAKLFNLPVNIHSRKSHDQIIPFLKRANLKRYGVIHGFAGSYAQAKRFVDLGYKIGVGGTITYTRANKTRQTISQLPLDALLLETDSPDMPVFGFQGQPNRPERLLHIFKVLCELRKESPAQIEHQIWQNSCSLFAG